MVVGILSIELRIDGAFSLKDKRAVLNRLRDRVRDKFNVAVAEVGDQDVWNSAVIGVAAISNDQVFVNQVLSKVMALVETIHECRVEDFSTEFIS